MTLVVAAAALVITVLVACGREEAFREQVLTTRGVFGQTIAHAVLIRQQQVK